MRYVVVEAEPSFHFKILMVCNTWWRRSNNFWAHLSYAKGGGKGAAFLSPRIGAMMLEFPWEFPWANPWANPWGEFLLFFFWKCHPQEGGRERKTARQAGLYGRKAISIYLNFLMLNGQAFKKRQTLRMVRLCYTCLGTFELFLHARIPTFTATFGKNRVEMLLHRFALFFHCVIEVFVVLVCQLGVVFYKSECFNVSVCLSVQLTSRYFTFHLQQCSRFGWLAAHLGALRNHLERRVAALDFSNGRISCTALRHSLYLCPLTITLLTKARIRVLNIQYDDESIIMRIVPFEPAQSGSQRMPWLSWDKMKLIWWLLVSPYDHFTLTSWW